MQGEIDRAVGLWQKVLEIDPDNQNAKNNISKAAKIID
jgi:cytochrome c-type biogenesis protein CcmH/NrfG